MNIRFAKLLVLCIALTMFWLPLRADEVAAKEKESVESSTCMTEAMVKFQREEMKLWMDHVYWTRSYVVSAIEGLKDQEKVLERLLRNQQDIGDSIKPYYGEAAGNQLAAVLKEHILIAGKVVDAAKKGNKKDFNKYNKEWYKNADDIAEFLSKANPNWTYEQLQQLLYMHLQLLTDDVTARLQKDWDKDISSFDKGLDHIIKLADTISEGIMKQFPDRFK